MEQWTRRAALTAVTAAGAAALIGAAPPQRGRRNVPSAPVLEIATGENAFTAPDRTVAGAVTLRVRNTSPRTGTVGVVRLHPGVTEEQFRTRLRALFTAEAPADIIDASRVMMATATQLGGASHHSGAVADAIVTLAPGRHLLLEYLDFMPGLGRGPAPGEEYVRPLTVTADGPGGWAPVPCGTLTAHESADGSPRFSLRGRVLADQPLRFVNAMREQVDEARLYPVTDDSVTEADIVAFFAGGSGPPPVDFPGALGATPLTPGHEVVLRMPMRSGRYAVVSWVRSLVDARPLTAGGQVLLVRVP